MSYYEERFAHDRAHIVWEPLPEEDAEQIVAFLLNSAPRGSRLFARVRRDAPDGEPRTVISVSAKMNLADLASLLQRAPLPADS